MRSTEARHPAVRDARRPSRARGFTLVEMVVTVVLLGIVSAMVARFTAGSMQAYLDAQRRAELADTVGIAMDRLQRDLRDALPDSLRITTAGGVAYLEYLPVVAEGRYRAGATGLAPPGPCAAGRDDPLAVGTPDTSFSTLGPVPDLPASGGTHFVVVRDPAGRPTAKEAYAGAGNRARYTGASSDDCESAIGIEPHAFAHRSSAARFQVIGLPVTYACNPATGQLTRLEGYAISPVQPAPPPGRAALMLDGLVRCEFRRQAGSVAVTLERRLANETLRLHQELHLDGTR